jgi:hypothetical protein
MEESIPRHALAVVESKKGGIFHVLRNVDRPETMCGTLAHRGEADALRDRRLCMRCETILRVLGRLAG